MPEIQQEAYISVFLNSALATGEVEGVLTIFLLFLARMFPIIAQSPFLGARVLPHPVKVSLAISLFVIFFPQMLLLTTTPIGFNFNALLLLFKEILIGFILGFIISIPFSIVQNAGMIIDHQRGGASLMVNDPTIQNQSSPVGTLLNMVLIFLFWVVDIPFLFIDAIFTSYEIVPPDQFINPNFFDAASPFRKTQIELLNKVMVVSIQLATPALLAILMTDVFLGIVNRLAPQVQITFLGMPLKSLLGLGVICFGWNLLTTQMVKDSYVWLNSINDVFKLMKTPIP
ncbi:MULTISPECIES: EscT/YscT/HrcT family type III secretion system export apparatus protein [Parachlamydia]|jgi:type III secretory pathway component EscT|uniref:Type III secretion integral inner membrane protein n=2 Tax=Parachlamydia acanthamoebae TaxID=83552 RepID=F8KV25_PARAV|nr:flagellar biosynthetic protein FliR [Parachlamydia acanthamoebae]EFB41208.1 putative type III secretion inner membrane protein SctT [Parachlamydia acanthamoebae str. Hall's coccus]CCB85098.1 type III secretion integral inner membrane protein [Parachlamydia acanthamoebae UV-7]